ncbi:DUF3090 domain-containing protein [soil metagenome]
MALEGGPDFTVDVDVAIVEAIGEPGQRRFRIITAANGETTIMWMEKQQLDALGQAIDQILLQLEDTPISIPGDTSNAPFDVTTLNQFRVGRLEIGFDQEHDRILIIAYDIESGEEEAPSLAGLFSRDLAKSISEEAAKVVAAGRPRCVLCGLPMGPDPHACAQQNGHLASYA